MRNDNDMKIGLVPLLYEEYNYGGVLQFYALQKTIKSLGYNADILKMPDGGLVCKQKGENENVLKRIYISVIKACYSVINKRNDAIINKSISVRKEKIRNFKLKYYEKTRDIEDDESFNDYSAVICGSDQIWNPKWAKKRTMLATVPDNINKIIYAASIGCEEMTETEKRLFKPLVERLQHVSVRETSAKKLLDSFVCGLDIKVVLDPTILLKASEWDEIAVNSPHNNYILTYFLGDSSEYKSYVEKVAKDSDMIIVNIPFASGERVDKCILGDNQTIDLSPEEFIGWIKSAQIVFTDSFHACVFSVLYKRPFYVFERKGSTNMIGRIKTLQEHFQLDNRIIDAKTQMELSFSNYSSNDHYQNALIADSLSYLKKSLDNVE